MSLSGNLVALLHTQLASMLYSSFAVLAASVTGRKWPSPRRNVLRRNKIDTDGFVATQWSENPCHAIHLSHCRLDPWPTGRVNDACASSKWTNSAEPKALK